MWLINNLQMQEYIKVCEAFCSDDKLFKNFKSNPSYNRIVGMSREYQAREWSKKIREDKELFQKMTLFKRNDVCAPPGRYSDENFGTISPSTMRYVFTLHNIKRLFGLNTKDISKIIEIGGGYGGLAFILSNYFNLEKYCVIDLPEVTQLCKKYLNRMNVKCFTDVDVEEKYDLLIAEYSLTEFDDTQMELYYNKYILKSEMIYVAENFGLREEKRRAYWLEKFKQDFNVVVEEEYPYSGYKNYIWACTRKK